MLLNLTTYIDDVEQSSINTTYLTDILAHIWTSVSTNATWIDSILAHKDKSEQLWANKDCEQYKLMQYLYALLLTGLIHLDIAENGLQDTFEYYDEKFDVLESARKLGCNGISLTNIFYSFNITIMNLR